MLSNRDLVGLLEAFMHEVDLLGLDTLLERRVFCSLVFAGLPVRVEWVLVDELRLFECGGASALVQGYVKIVLNLGLILIGLLLGFLNK